MFFTYLRRELAGRRRQTAIIAIGMALAIALVMIVNAVSTGVRDAQAAVLESVYGVGTDLTVAQEPTPPGEGEGGPRFEFDAGDGTTADGSTEISQSRLMAGFGSTTFDAEALATVAGPRRRRRRGRDPRRSRTRPSTASCPSSGRAPPMPRRPTANSPRRRRRAASTAPAAAPSTSTASPCSASTPRPTPSARCRPSRSTRDADSRHPTPATPSPCSTRPTRRAPTSRSATRSTSAAPSSRSSAPCRRPRPMPTTAANVYIPLDLAQSISGEDGMISSISVQADVVRPDRRAAGRHRGGAARCDGLDAGRPRRLGLGLARERVEPHLEPRALGVARRARRRVPHRDPVHDPGVTRRTREFGTLKAIGWSNRRIVGQVVGRIPRAGPHRRRRGPRARARRHLGREPHRADASAAPRAPTSSRADPAAGGWLCRPAPAAASPARPPRPRARPRSC